MQRKLVVISVSAGIAGISATLLLIAHSIVLLGGLVLAVALVIQALVLRSELHPVDMLAAQIDAIDGSNPSKRVVLDDPPPEIGLVADRLNGLLAKLELTLMREKAVSAEIAHDLRTPVAGLKTSLEVAASHARSSQEYQETIQNCLEVVGGMESMVGDLLTLADPASSEIRRPDQVAVKPLLETCWRPFEQRAAEHGIAVQWNLGDNDISVKSDREKLKIVLFNIFDNAVSYTDHGGVFRIGASIPAGGPVLTFVNSGCMLGPEDRKNVFERFWRGDKSRALDRGHCGLGLPLAKRASEAIGATMAVDISNSGEFALTLSLPA
jgi:signal transduction histidine kinase